MMKSAATVGSHQLVEMDGVAGAQLQQGLVPVEDHMGAPDQDPGRLGRQEGSDGRQGQPASPAWKTSRRSWPAPD